MVKFLLKLILAVCFIAGLVATSRAISPYFIKKNTLPADASVSVTASSTTNTGALGTTTPVFDPANITDIDISSWSTYEDGRFGYSIKHPGDLIKNSDGETVILAFPKDKYFHWPLLDDAKITLTVSSSSFERPCPPLSMESNIISAPTSTLTIDGHEFTWTESEDVALGNHYKDIAFDTVIKGSCYQLILKDHGANGAGLYVDDMSLGKRYDNIHESDLKAVEDIFYRVVASFHKLP